MTQTCIPSHYQAVMGNDVEIFDKANAIDIATMLYILSAEDPTLLKMHGYVFTCEEEADTWGIVTFLKSFNLFPTVAPNHYGAVIQFKGKEYVLYFEEDGALIIGYEDTLYRLEGSDSEIANCIDVDVCIFQEGLIERIFTVTPDSN